WTADSRVRQVLGEQQGRVAADALRLPGVHRLPQRAAVPVGDAHRPARLVLGADLAEDRCGPVVARELVDGLLKGLLHGRPATAASQCGSEGGLTEALDGTDKTPEGC